MTDRTGILKNSPLVYTLASIRFASWPFMVEKISTIHDELRDITPLIKHIQVQALDLSGQAVHAEGVASVVWMFMSSDRSYGFHLTPDQLLVFSSKYRRYADFEETIGKGLEVLLKHMRFVDVTNIGVRYVDHIKMLDGEKFQHYITESLLPAEFEGFERMGGLITGLYKVDDVELHVRCDTRPDALSVPEDIISILAMAQEPSKPLQLKMLTSREFLLDMDAIKHYPTLQRMEDNQIILQQLKQLHQVANDFFRHKAVCTDDAFKQWKGED
ncbi:MAG: TIGR04255 family protein [Methylobacter sp.]